MIPFRRLLQSQTLTAFLLIASATSVDAFGQAIPIKPGSPIQIRKILPTDSRIVRGFAHGPVDGRVDTRYPSGPLTEWSGRYGAVAVNYGHFHGNNGLHVTLADNGVDAILMRGTWVGTMFVDMPGLTPPTDTKPLCEIRPKDDVFRLTFDQRIQGEKFSFFYEVNDLSRTLNDLTFLQVSNDHLTKCKSIVLRPNPANASRDVLPEQFELPEDRSTIHQLDLGSCHEGSIDIANGGIACFRSPIQSHDSAIGSMTFRFDIDSLNSPTVLGLRIRDTLDPRREVMAADVEVHESGEFAVTLDHPDLVFVPPLDQWQRQPRFEALNVPQAATWLSVESSNAIKLKNVRVELHPIPRSKAMHEAAAWRRFILKGLFQWMSEPRPWMHLKNIGPISEQVATSPAINRYRPQLIEVLENLEITRQLLPNDDVVQQYHNWVYQNVDRYKPHPPPNLPNVPNAPKWAIQVREGWRHTSRIARWWLDHRQVDNGELGGGINDDTDMFQTWQCLPMIESAPLGQRLKDAAARLANTAVEHVLEEGINTRRKDALHAYEEGINHLALCAWWFYGDPVHFERLMASARSTIKLMVVTDDGRSHFGGSHFGIDEVRNGFQEIARSPGDGNWAPARYMLHSLYTVGLYNRNPAVVEAFERWGTTWRNYQKKDAWVGQVDIKTGEPTIVSASPTPSATGPVPEWLMLYQITDDPKWIEPFTFQLDSDGYIGTAVRYGRMPHALVDWPEPYQSRLKARVEDGSGGYAGFFLHKNRSCLDEWLNTSASWFGRYKHMGTAAEQKTDRVLNYRASVPLSCYLGDAPNRNRFTNLTAVSYEGLKGDDFAALVWDAGPDRLKVAMYNFADDDREGLIRVWRLRHGRYRIRIGTDDAPDDGNIDQIRCEAERTLRRYDAIPIQLSAGKVTIIEVEQLEELDRIQDRADLAVSPLDSNATSCGGYELIVHNIGSKTATDVTIEHRRGKQLIATKTIDELESPHDLYPRTITLHFTDAKPGDTFVVDPENEVPEITDVNNRIDWVE